jgi:hypothetical protein
MADMYGYDAIPFEASAFKKITNEALCRLKSKNWYKEKVKAYADRKLRYEILSEAQKGRSELAINIEEICYWIRKDMPDYVVCDTKFENGTQDTACIDETIADCFYNYMEEAGFSIDYIDSVSRQQCIRW